MNPPSSAAGAETAGENYKPESVLRSFFGVLHSTPSIPISGGRMSTASPQEVTRLLQAWSQGEESALDRLVPLVYRELHLRARRCMAREREPHSLQTTALIHEAYLRLVGSSPVAWESRNHFFAIAPAATRIAVSRAEARPPPR